MKRGLVFGLFIIALFLLNSFAQGAKDELRINVDTKILGKEGIFINLTEFLGRSLDYYLVNKPQYVKVNIDSDFKLAHITPIEGRTGSEVIIITTNKSKEFSIKETETISERVEDTFQETLKQDFNFSYDPIVNKALLETMKNLKLQREEIYSTYVNFSGNVLFINVDNRTALNLSFTKLGDDFVLENISLGFESEEQDSENLFYERKGFFSNFIYFIKNNIMNALIFVLGLIFIVLIILIITTKRKKEISKEDFKKGYVNKITLLKRSCHEANKDNIFTQFSHEMRDFLARMLGIKYQFTYDELINELIVKKADESVKKDLTKFSKAMLEVNYRKNPSLKEVKEFIERGISIMKRF
ncbi:MAG: hypothetical protein AABW58_03685 [Nanoarchaeota archaeon]